MGTDPARLSLSLPQHTVYRSVSKWVMPQYMAIKNGEIVFQASINRGIVGYFKVMFFIFRTLEDFFWSRFWWCSKPIQTMGLSASSKSPNLSRPVSTGVPQNSEATLWQCPCRVGEVSGCHWGARSWQSIPQFPAGRVEKLWQSDVFNREILGSPNFRQTQLGSCGHWWSRLEIDTPGSRDKRSVVGDIHRK